LSLDLGVCRYLQIDRLPCTGTDRYPLYWCSICFRNVAAALTAEKRLRRRERTAAEIVALVEYGKADKSGLRRRR